MISGFFQITKRWLFSGLLLFVFSCKQASTKNELTAKQSAILKEKKINGALLEINKDKGLVLSGDLIMRTGNDFTSTVVRKLSIKDKTYSHCGMANWENDTLFVYHAIGGEWNPDQKIRRDPFYFFCNPYENKGFGIFRYQISNEKKEKIVNKCKQLFADEIMFDMHFNLATDDRMYCTEFIYKIVNEGVADSIKIKTTNINNIKFVATDNLFSNPYCTEIKRVVF